MGVRRSDMYVELGGGAAYVHQEGLLPSGQQSSHPLPFRLPLPPYPYSAALTIHSIWSGAGRVSQAPVLCLLGQQAGHTYPESQEPLTICRNPDLQHWTQ